jgi:hypothetical protein
MPKYRISRIGPNSWVFHCEQSRYRITYTNRRRSYAWQIEPASSLLPRLRVEARQDALELVVALAAHYHRAREDHAVDEPLLQLLAAAKEGKQ